MSMDEKQFSLSARCAKIKFLSVARLLLASLFLGSALGIFSHSAHADPTGVATGSAFCTKHGQYSGSECPGCARERANAYTPPADTRDYEAERRQQEAMQQQRQ